MRPGEHRFVVGEVVEMKKPHPCGAAQWEIWRTGIDFGIKCLGCGRRVMIPRKKFERQVRRVVSPAPGAPGPSRPPGPPPRER